MTLQLTNSEKSTFQDCKRRWYLGTYRRLQKKGRDDFNRPSSIGTRLHEVLEAYYTPGQGEERARELLAGGVYKDLIEHPVQERNILKEADLCDAMFEGYLVWLAETGADADLEPVAAEKEVEVPLVDGVTLMSKIDVQVRRRTDGKTSSIDHKSVGNFKDPRKKLQVDSQLLTQHLTQHLAELQEGDHPESSRVYELIYGMLRKVKRTPQAKPPFYDRETVKHSVGHLRSHWKHCVSVAEEILEVRRRLDSGEDHQRVVPPRPTADCTWKCPFSDVCLSGMIDDGTSDWEGYLAENFEEHDPLDRYKTHRVEA